MCCTNPDMKCYEKDGYWAGCKESCKPGIDPSDPPEYQTPWTCKVLSKDDAGPTPAPPPPSTFDPPTGRRRRSKSIPEAPAGSVVAAYGQLKTEGNKIVNKDGKPIRLRGMSLFWSQWKPQFYTKETVQWLISDWKVTLIRAAMAVEEGGYLSDPDTEKEKVEVVVKACIEAGVYVLIDWHDHKAENHLDEAQEFFNDMAEKYGQYPNVLFETYNEPTKQSWDDVIKPYHEAVVPTIRHHTENIVICGTRTWSQEVNVAGLRPVKGTNIAYTLHFYASSAAHQAPLRSKADIGLKFGVPLFVTEWGTCEYTGNGKVDLDQTQTWLDYLDENYISDANWAIGDKDETCAALKPGASPGGWDKDDLTVSGQFMRDSIRKDSKHGAEMKHRRRRRSVKEPARRRRSGRSRR